MKKQNCVLKLSSLAAALWLSASQFALAQIREIQVLEPGSNYGLITPLATFNPLLRTGLPNARASFGMLKGVIPSPALAVPVPLKKASIITPAFAAPVAVAADIPVIEAAAAPRKTSAQGEGGKEKNERKKPEPIAAKLDTEVKAGTDGKTLFDAAAKSKTTVAVEPGAEPSAKPTWDKAKPLPPSVEIPSSLASVDAAVEMGVSHSYPGKPGVDPSVLVAQDIDAYIAFKGIPNSEKHFILKYFEIGDPPGGHSPVVQAIERLVKAGIKTTILTDFNQSMTGVFDKDELHNTDFEKGTYKDGGPGRALKYIRESLGFKLKFGEGKFTVLSGVPFFNPRDKSEKPLMHDKGYVALGVGGKAWDIAGNGTANMNATQEKADGALPSYGGRYNRVFRHKDVAGNQVDFDHALAEIKAYDERTSSKGLAEELNVPKRITYPNGEYREIAFTNGKQNPNDRIIAALQKATQALIDAKAAKGEPKFALKEIIFSHFVLTDTPEVDALRKYLDALRDFYPNDYKTKVKIFGVFDQQFISPSGFGEAAALDGILVQRPMGKSIFPFRSEYSEMMELFGYVRLIEGTKSVDPDKAPSSVHLWHDKTTVIKAAELNEKTNQMEDWVYAWSRSLNDSGHFQSLESQDMYRLKPDSKLAKDFEDTIKEVVKAEPQYAISLDKAIAVEVLAQITHHTRYDDGMLGYAEKVIDALIKANYQLVESLLTEIIALPTKHVKAVDGEAVKKGVGHFVHFMGWYADEAKKDPSLSKMTYRKALNIGIGLTGSVYGLRTALDILYWGPKRTPEQIEALMKKAWTEGLQMTEAFPEPKVPAKPAA